VSDALAAGLLAIATGPASAPPNVTRGQPPELEGRSPRRNDRVPCGELAQRLLIVQLRRSAPDAGGACFPRVAGAPEI
jgi:hypothetical protein